jgi:hypothetical protein
VADTELKGVFQGDIIVRTAIIRAMDLVRADPKLLDHVFHSLAEDELTRDVYGAKQIAEARKWFMKTDIPVFMNFRVAEEALPCITISLQESAEADQTHGDVHYVTEERSPGDWPALTEPFTPVAYSPGSGIMVLPIDVMGNRVVAAGMQLVTRDGRSYTIMQNLGDDEISLKPGTVDDFTNAVIKGATDRFATTVESVTFKEVYQIGIHVMGEPTYLLHLHSIVQFMLLKYKQELLETRGFERTSLTSTDFRRNLEFDNEEVFARFITITGYARHYWPKATNPLIDVVDTQPAFEPTFAYEPGLVPAPAPPPVDDQGEGLNDDDAWGVIPVE